MVILIFMQDSGSGKHFDKRVPRFGLFFLQRPSTKSKTVIKLGKCKQTYDQIISCIWEKNIFAATIQQIWFAHNLVGEWIFFNILKKNSFSK